MAEIKLLKHAKGAPGLRFLGLGPNLLPRRGVAQLKHLLNKHAFWAKGRSDNQLRLLLARSSAVVSLWNKSRMIGFGRATSDGIFRAVLWDVIVPEDLQGQGIGRAVVETLLKSKSIISVERVYLMTTNSSQFYNQFDFHPVNKQVVLLREQKISFQ